MGHADSAQVLARADVQAKVQAVLNAPVLSIRLVDGLGSEGAGSARGDEPFGLDPVLGFGAIDATGQPRRLGDKGETRGFGAGVKTDQAAGFQASAIEFGVLNDVLSGPRGKKRGSIPLRVVARSDRPWAG